MFQWGTCQMLMFSSRCLYSRIAKDRLFGKSQQEDPLPPCQLPLLRFEYSVLFPDTTCVLVRELQGNMSTGCLITVF